MVLAAASFVEDARGTDLANQYIYHHAWFCVAWATWVACALYVVVRKRLWKRPAVFALHISLVCILAGAFLTFVSGKKGFIHLRTGGTTFLFVEQESRRTVPMPFVLRLDTFRVECYPATDMPMDYVSSVSCLSMDGNLLKQADISMNHVLKFEGYRLYQSSYDEDGQGSIFSVNYDPWGTPVTYLGYVCMAISMIGVLLSRRSAFCKLLKHPLLRAGAAFLFLSLWIFPAGAALPDKVLVAQAEADSLSTTQVVYQGRVTLFNTLSNDFLKKIHGRNTFEGLSSDRVMGSWMKHSEYWRTVRIIKIKDKELRKALGIEGKYASVADLTDGGNHRLANLRKRGFEYGGKPSAMQKALMEADEKVALIDMMIGGALVKPVPDDDSIERLPSVKVQAEWWYNHIPFGKISFMFSLCMGVLSLGWLMHRALSERLSGCKRVATMFRLMLLAACVFHAAGYLLRWYIGGRIPLGNGFETMQFMALCVLSVAFLLRHRFFFVVPFGFLLSGFVLLVAYLGQMNPQITPLMPVLNSPWLSVHVSFIMMAYALLAFIWMNGILGLCWHRETERLMLFSRLLLYPAVFFMGVGIFIGAVWANVSWGRYWAWDPKEVWALITFMVYAVPFHTESLPWFHNSRHYHLYMVLAFLCVVMTYWGVNTLLGGMHSYAG